MNAAQLASHHKCLNKLHLSRLQVCYATAPSTVFIYLEMFSGLRGKYWNVFLFFREFRVPSLKQILMRIISPSSEVSLFQNTLSCTQKLADVRQTDAPTCQ